MTGEIEAIGDLATGMVLASAVEPQTGAANAPDSSNCLNCGAVLTTPYCGQCGQKGKIHRTLSAFWHDLMHSVFHFDGKIWRTLPLLAFKPGHLTRRYVHGERARFVSPLALLLFTVFLMFATFNLLGANDLVPRNAVKQQNKAHEMLAKKNETVATIGRLEKEIAAAQKAQQPVTALQEELESERTSLKLLEAAGRVMLNPNIELNVNQTNTGFTSRNPMVQHALENPQLFFYKIQAGAYKYSWALILLSTPFVWLLFAFRREHKMFDHAVFATYSICFMMALFTAGAVAVSSVFLAAPAGIVLGLVPPVHMYKQLKYAYGLSRSGAIWRTILMAAFALIVLMLFAFLVVTLGAVG